MVLIGNYPPDGQQSMVRFAQMMETGFKNAGIETITWKPVVFLGAHSKSTISGVGKWLGYIDKWVIFPMVLRRRVRRRDMKGRDANFHICDHSNAPYLKSLPADRTAITCHDVLAIRGALGYKDAFCNATRMGKVLQKWILGNLAASKKIACVSQLTLRQLKEIAPEGADLNKDWKVIHNAFNAAFEPLSREEAWPILQKAGLESGVHFLLHVGSSLPRKNRKLLLEMVAELGKKYLGKICFAGEAIDAELLEHTNKLKLDKRMISVVAPDHITLTALYSVCDAFIFPSFSEGFGWPVIEAQACGVPVIASDIEPMPEVSGGAALHADPYNPKSFAEAYLSLHDNAAKEKLIEGGLLNARRFNSEEMIASYVQLHQLQL